MTYQNKTDSELLALMVANSTALAAISTILFGRQQATSAPWSSPPWSEPQPSEASEPQPSEASGPQPSEASGPLPPPAKPAVARITNGDIKVVTKEGVTKTAPLAPPKPVAAAPKAAVTPQQQGAVSPATEAVSYEQFKALVNKLSKEGTLTRASFENFLADRGLENVAQLKDKNLTEEYQALLRGDAISY